MYEKLPKPNEVPDDVQCLTYVDFLADPYIIDPQTSFDRIKER